MKRSGFTLIELIVATVVMAILGTALVRMLVADSKFVSKVNASMNARQSVRAAMTIMTAELAMVSDSGLTAATNKTITVRVPYAFGMACRSSGPNLFASLAPLDSMMFASATASGVAWRDSTETYQFIPGVTVNLTSSSNRCTQDSIRTIPGGQRVRIRNGSSIPSGRIIYLYQNVTYSFENSTSMSGRIGLFRTDGSGTKEELLVPFDTSAGFGFLVGNNMAATSVVPSDLNTVRGLELNLTGESYQNPQGETDPAQFELTTSVAFRNHVN